MRILVAAGLAPLLLTGCQREQISSYRVPKETNHVTSATPAVTEPTRSTRPEIRWSKLPPGWTEGQPSSMRVASFGIDGGNGQKAEVSVTPLSVATDIEGSSLNMWRGELALPPAEPPSLSKSAESVSVGGATGRLYDFAGMIEGQKARIIGAVLTQDGATWFFKMRGSDDLVAAQKPAFTSFLKSVSFVAAASPPMMAAASPRAGAPSDTESGSHPLPKWDVPKHWQTQPATTMLLAVFTVPGDPGQAQVTVSSLARDGGGLRLNLDRWRGQIGLGPATDNELAQSTSPLDVTGNPATVVDTKNDSNGKRTVVVILPHHGQSWFFKLSGPDAVVAKEKAGFIKFVQSVRFH